MIYNCLDTGQTISRTLGRQVAGVIIRVAVLKLIPVKLPPAYVAVRPAEPDLLDRPRRIGVEVPERGLGILLADKET